MPSKSASGVPLMPHEPIVGEGVFSHESGIHTAAILVHPAIYQFIREETWAGPTVSSSGSTPAPAAVEAVLKKHHARLEAQGVEVNDALVDNTLERAKELRAKMIENGHAGRTIRQHYDNMEHLGISEDGLIELALEMHAERYSRS